MPKGKYKHTAEQHKKIAEARKKNGTYSHTKDFKEKMRLLYIGRKRPGNPDNWKHTEETKKRIAQTQTGNTFSKGIKWSEESRRKITKIRSHQELEWGKFRNCVEYREWRTAVFQRDDYTCQDCGEKGGRLQADHIKKWAEYPELRLELSNGKTLCEDCHKKTPNFGNRHQIKHELQHA